MKPEEILGQLIKRYPKLMSCKEEIHKTFIAWISCFDKKGKLMICGNGGSNADSQHIVGELMKDFYKKRAMNKAFLTRLDGMFPENNLSSKIQSPLTAMALGINQVLTSAFSNDVAPEMIFAQEVYGYARENDILLALSTSGNSENVVNAIRVARAMDIKCIGICGAKYETKNRKLSQLCDICIVIPEKETYLVQELTLPTYHALCRMAEAYYW